MLKSLKKRSYRFVVVLLLLITLLTFDVGRVTKVEAAATTAAIMASALLATGAVYIGYLSLTGATVSIPFGTGSDVEDYLREIGQKVVGYTSGAPIYSYVYNKLRNVVGNTLADVDFTFSRDELLDIYNDFKDTSIIQNIMSYSYPIDLDTIYTNGYVPNFTISQINQITQNGDTFADLQSQGWVISPYGGVDIMTQGGGLYYIVNTNIMYQVRNVLMSNGRYRAEYYNNGSWQTLSLNGTHYRFGLTATYNNNLRYLLPYGIYNYYFFTRDDYYYLNNTASDWAYPLMPHERIYDEPNQVYLPMEEVTPDHYQLSPNWNDDNDNRKYPIVPYVKLPQNNGLWGFNLDEFIEGIKQAAGTGIQAGLIAQLINAFRDAITGDTNYIYYDNSVTGDTYYEYYNNTYNDYDYPVYNINVSEQEDVIPVDLNTIQQYTNNQYLTLIKERAETFGETFGELVAFWHNCDPEIIYAFLGASIIVLLGAFIGKWGHS